MQIRVNVSYRKIISCFSTKTYVVGTQNKHLNEMVLFRTQNICWKLRVRKYCAYNFTQKILVYLHVDLWAKLELWVSEKWRSLATLREKFRSKFKFSYIYIIYNVLNTIELLPQLILGRSETNEPWHGISNNVVCATSKALDQTAHRRSLIRAFASHLHILWVLSYWLNIIWSF